MRISDWSSDVCSSDLLQIWRWGPHMLVSILHRATGDGLALVGLGVLLWWLGALASGPEAYARFAELAVTIPGRVVLIGLSWALFTHLMSGQIGRATCRERVGRYV